MRQIFQEEILLYDRTGTDQGAWRKILEMERKQVGERRAQPVTRSSRPLAA